MLRFISVTIVWFCLALSCAWAHPVLPEGVDPSEFCGPVSVSKIRCHHTNQQFCQCKVMQCGVNIKGDCSCGIRSDSTRRAADVDKKIDFSLQESRLELPVVNCEQRAFTNVFPRHQNRDDDVPTPPPPQF